jgi:hypothetical protein
MQNIVLHCNIAKMPLVPLAFIFNLSHVPVRRMGRRGGTVRSASTPGSGNGGGGKGMIWSEVCL